jgi:cold shock CspA family protein
MSYTGTVKKWFPVGAFGWIQRDDGKPDAFLHIRHCAAQFTPQEGQRVSFELVVDDCNPRGRADNIRPYDAAADAGDADDDHKLEWLNEHRARHRGE